jgi:putative chitinase
MSKYNKKGRPLKSRKYFVLHHTGGRGSAEDVMNILNNRKGGALGVQYIIDEDGKVFMGLPSGTIGAHVSGSNRIGGPSDLSNSNTEGVEIVGGNDTKITLNQCKTALILIKSLGYSVSDVYGHGEIQSNKMPSEGATCKRYVQKYWSTPENQLPTEDSEITKKQGVKLNTDSKVTDKPKEVKNISLSQTYYKGKAAENINMIVNKLKQKGITNPIAQAGILATIGKESGFIPQNEIGYCTTPDARVIKIFSDRGRKCKNLKCDNEKFFDCVYGKDSGATLGNTQPGDGYKYRGRGFNQITGRSNYKKYGYESNPDQLNDTEGAAEAAIDFLASEGSSLNNRFKTVDDAVVYFVTKNAGGRRSSMGERKANEVLAKFEVGSGSSGSDSLDSTPSDNLATTSGGSSTEDKSKLNVLDLMGLGGLNAMISLAKGDEEGFKKNIEKQEALQEQSDRIKDIIKKIL